MNSEAKQERTASIDLVVSDLEMASGFIEAITESQSKERMLGFPCYSFPHFDVMLSESALIETGKASGVILHVQVPDVDDKVSRIQERVGLNPNFGPKKQIGKPIPRYTLTNRWDSRSTYSAIQAK